MLFEEKVNDFIKKCAEYSYKLYSFTDSEFKSDAQSMEEATSLIKDLMDYMVSFKKEYLLALSKDHTLLKYNSDIVSCQNILYDALKQASTYSLLKITLPQDKNKDFFN